MFAQNRDDHRDDIPLWTWFLILPGIVLVTVLVIRRLRYQARLSQAQPSTAQEFRLEASRPAPMRTGVAQPTVAARITTEAVDTGEIARPVERDQILMAGLQAADEAKAGNSSVPEETQVAASAALNGGDDLKIIEGIGPKIEAILKNAGIITFRQLADTSVEQLYQVLHNANLRLADPGTWPEQARLAANENWDFLKALQARTKAGRRSIED